MNAKQLLFGLTLFLMFSISVSAQGSDGHNDARQARIELNKKKVKKYAAKRLEAICRHGFTITNVELYRGGTYKVHFKTNCEQIGEVHYTAESAKYRKTIYH